MATKSLGDEFYYIEAILGRCGVPIFFMISGYFAARHVKKDPENSGRWFLKNALRMIWQFLLFSVIIFAFYRLGNLLFHTDDLTLTINKDRIFRLLVLNEPLFSGVLWYLLAYAYCLLIYAAASHFKMGLPASCPCLPSAAAFVLHTRKIQRPLFWGVTAVLLEPKFPDYRDSHVYPGLCDA